MSYPAYEIQGAIDSLNELITQNTAAFIYVRGRKHWTEELRFSPMPGSAAKRREEIQLAFPTMKSTTGFGSLGASG